MMWSPKISWELQNASTKSSLKRKKLPHNGSRLPLPPLLTSSCREYYIFSGALVRVYFQWKFWKKLSRKLVHCLQCLLSRAHPTVTPGTPRNDGVYTRQFAMMARHMWRVYKSSSKTRKNRNACIDALRSAVPPQKKLQVYTSDANWLKHGQSTFVMYFQLQKWTAHLIEHQIRKITGFKFHYKKFIIFPCGLMIRQCLQKPHRFQFPFHFQPHGNSYSSICILVMIKMEISLWPWQRTIKVKYSHSSPKVKTITDGYFFPFHQRQSAKPNRYQCFRWHFNRITQ